MKQRDENGIKGDVKVPPDKSKRHGKASHKNVTKRDEKRHTKRQKRYVDN